MRIKRVMRKLRLRIEGASEREGGQAIMAMKVREV